MTYCIPIEPCHQYRWLNQTSRSISKPNFDQELRCDTNIANTWYRFGGIDGNYVIQTDCLETIGACQTVSPGWMQGSHPQGSLNGLNIIFYLAYFIQNYSNTLIKIVLTCFIVDIR